MHLSGGLGEGETRGWAPCSLHAALTKPSEAGATSTCTDEENGGQSTASKVIPRVSTGPGLWSVSASRGFSLVPCTFLWTKRSLKSQPSAPSVFKGDPQIKIGV